MGYIYKITNNINQKVYIGQTIKDYSARFKQHKNNYTKPYFSHLALYQAFSKYGIENFNFEPIEEVNNDELDEREKYWIKYYDSYKNGYNSTLGGREIQLYDWDESAIIQRYYELKSARKVAQEIGCDHNTIDVILNRNNIKRFSHSETMSTKNVIIEKGEIKETFTSVRDCALWMINHGYTKSKNIENVSHYLRERLREEKPYCNFKVYYESKIQSVPLVTVE